jgi:hypothetical protein
MKFVVNCSSGAGPSQCKHTETAYTELDVLCSQE